MSSFFHAGAVLEGRFKLATALGEGATGTVWLAKDLHLGINVAVKVMQAALREDSARKEMFEKEAELCARMLSPHIVRVLSYGVTGSGVPYIIYEALEGEPLDTRIAAKKRLGLDETEEIVVHVARALARAHSMGIVHKDIKPGNVFMTKDDRGRVLAKVLDFGIAEVVQPHVTIAGELCGTLEYMPLEVLRDARPADARADLFALAVLAYECLSGEVPYVAESIEQVMKIMSGAPPSLTGVFSEEAAVPLDMWMRRGLAPDAGLRYQSARDLAESFHDAVKQAKFALGVVPPASSRKLSQHDMERVDPNSVDTFTQKPSRGSQVPLHRSPQTGPVPPPPMRAGTQKLGTMQPAKLGTMQPAQQSRLPTMQPSQAKPPTMREFTPGTRPVQPMQSKPPTTPEFTPGTRPLQPMQSKPPTRPEFTPGNRPEGKLPTMQDSPFAKLPTMQPTAQKLSTMTPGSLRPTIPREDGPVPNPPAVIPGQKLGTLSPGSLRPTIPRDDDAPPPSHRAPTGMRPRAASFIFDEDLPPARRKQDSGVAIEEVAAESDRIADKRRE